MVDSDTLPSPHHPWAKPPANTRPHEHSKFRINQSKSRLWKWNSLVSGVTNLTNKHPFPQANCLQILVESPSILSLQIFATGPTFLTINQTHYERNDLIGWIAFEVCNAKTYELFMSTNVYKRFHPRVMEREERIGINRGLPTMVLNGLLYNCKLFVHK